MLKDANKKEKSKLLRKIGANLRSIRKEKAIEVKQISAWLNLSQQAYLNMENGKTDFSLTRILGLTEYLDIDLNRLLDVGSPEMPLSVAGDKIMKRTHMDQAHRSEPKDDGVIQILQHQLSFLQQQCCQLAVILEMHGETQSSNGQLRNLP